MNIFDEVDENLFRSLTGINKRKYVDILTLIWDKKNTKLAAYVDVLQFMLDKNCKVEQESIKALELME